MSNAAPTLASTAFAITFLFNGESSSRYVTAVSAGGTARRDFFRILRLKLPKSDGWGYKIEVPEALVGPLEAYETESGGWVVPATDPKLFRGVEAVPITVLRTSRPASRTGSSAAKKERT